jgi:hypothetical protein
MIAGYDKNIIAVGAAIAWPCLITALMARTKTLGETETLGKAKNLVKNPGRTLG